MKLRGKKLVTQNPKEGFTKIPNNLFTANLKPTEKLILMRLHYYPDNWVLAYTRVGKELGLRDDTMNKWWGSLKDKNIIVEMDGCYQIDYSMIPQIDIKYSTKYQLKNTTNKVVDNNTTTSVKRSNSTTNNVEKPTTENGDIILRKTELTTTNSVVTEEETKEEDLIIKTNNKTPKENENLLVENLLGKDSSSNFDKILEPITNDTIEHYFNDQLFLIYWKNVNVKRKKEELLQIELHDRVNNQDFDRFRYVKTIVDKQKANPISLQDCIKANHDDIHNLCTSYLSIMMNDEQYSHLNKEECTNIVVNCFGMYYEDHKDIPMVENSFLLNSYLIRVLQNHHQTL